MASLSTFPVEINQLIALELSDKDVGNFKLICQATRSAVGDYFYLLRFKATYDEVNLRSSDLKSLYQSRRKYMKRAPNFSSGQGRNETRCLEAIKHIIRTTKPVKDENDVPNSLNLQVLDQFLLNTNVLDVICTLNPRAPAPAPQPQHNALLASRRSANHGVPPQRVPITRLLTMIQLVLSSRSLRFLKEAPVMGFPESQKQAYMPAHLQGLFSDAALTRVNVKWCLHVVNFFRYHMMRRDEATLFQPYKDLDEGSDGLELPQFWKKQLTNEHDPIPLGKHWKGTYAYLDRPDMPRIRNTPSGRDVFTDHNVDQGDKAIQSLNITFPEKHPFKWPMLFENHLKSITYRDYAPAPPSAPPTTRAQRGAPPPAPVTVPVGGDLRFEGKGYDEEDFYSAGWINPLPPQEGIPGWKRMTMMKYFLDDNGQFDLAALWAYEGIVLPGAQIIVGRWWSADYDPAGNPMPPQNQYSGPFILWNTDCHFKKMENDRAAADDMDVEGVFGGA
ncbi:hypothetical protein EJ08DRAFT_660302 [Tothia fuscella]|uniref:Uncharacterized protein n=1 Tax=Tothia fuscella TaxID=1048955 RepID=A0A9P4NS51_9PEZI|nr:hypothetical protein EJ08DRAFT_660302 [Tothia fuscella]